MKRFILIKSMWSGNSPGPENGFGDYQDNRDVVAMRLQASNESDARRQFRELFPEARFGRFSAWRINEVEQ